MNNRWFRQSDPGVAMICVDQVNGDDISGRIYHKYHSGPISFANARMLCKELETLFDAIDFPQSSVRVAQSFDKKEVKAVDHAKAMELRNHPVTSVEEVMVERGEVASFAFRINSRLKATWQGELFLIQEEEQYAFRSMLEFLQIIHNSVQK